MNSNYNPGNATRAMMFRLLGMGMVLYWMMQTVVAYFKGGPDAPSLTLVIVSVIVLGGGAVFVGWVSWKAWKAEQALAKKMEEEARAEAAAAAEETPALTEPEED